MSEKPRPKPNPGLVAALRHYAKFRFDFSNPTVYVHQYGERVQGLWPLEQTCDAAANFIENEDLACLELRVLKDGLKRHGMSRLYEFIMGEKLD